MPAVKEKSTKPFTISNLVYLYKSKKLSLNPDFQREAVWSKYQKQLLVDSLLRDIDVPKLYFRFTNKGLYEAVDGQQRIRAIADYMGDKFSIHEEADKVEGHNIAKCKFNQLHTDLQMKFQNSQLDVVVLSSGYTDDDIEEIFLRLQNGTPLNAPEKRRALPGSMRNVVQKLSKNKVFHLCGFSSKRFAYEDATAKILHLLITGAITDIKPVSIKKTYKSNQGITEKSPSVADLKKAFGFISRAFKGKTSPRFRKYSLISLTYLTVELLDTYNLSQFPSQFADVFLDFERRRIENDEKDEEKQDPRLLAYTNAARADSVQDLEYRHEILKKEIVSSLIQLEPKDDVRQFTQEQRLAIFLRDKGICQDCGKKCKENAFHADHKKPYSKGGKTIIANGQVLCPECNWKKNNKEK